MKLFHDEVKEKKRTASNVHKMKGKRGYVGKVLFTSDLLKGKAKKEYQGTGKVRVWNMYDNMNKEEFEDMTQEQQKQALTKWREENTNKDIMTALEIKSSGAFHNLMTNLGVPKKQRGGSKRGRKKKNKEEPILQVVPNKIETIEEEKPKPKKKGMSFNWNLEDAEKNEIKEMLTKLEFLVENDKDKKFSINIEISELID